jgi:hypothetical protein
MHSTDNPFIDLLLYITATDGVNKTRVSIITYATNLEDY